MKLVINPTNSDLRILFRGSEYKLDANSSKEVGNEVADFWKNIHAFVEVRDPEAKKEEVPIEKPEKIEAKEEIEKEPEYEVSVREKLEEKTISELRDFADELDLDVSSRSKEPYVKAIEDALNKE